MAKTAINLYSVRELDDPMLDVLDFVADAGYDGVQFSGGLGDATPAEVGEKVAARGLDVAPAHVGIEQMEEDSAGVADVYGGLGCSGVVVPWLDAEHFETRGAVDDLAERLGGLAGTLAGYDLGLHYHNHDHEFTDLADGGNGFEALVDATDDVYFEVDVGWVHAAGHDPVSLLSRLGDRAPVVHMKDMTDDGHFAEIGDGAVDMQACADVANENGAEWLIYEHDEPADPRASIDHGAEFLDAL